MLARKVLRVLQFCLGLRYERELGKKSTNEKDLENIQSFYQVGGMLSRRRAIFCLVAAKECKISSSSLSLILARASISGK